jgi:hypothetical protein
VLLEKKISTAGMSDAELITTYKGITAHAAPMPAPVVEVAPIAADEIPEAAPSTRPSSLAQQLALLLESGAALSEGRVIELIKAHSPESKASAVIEVRTPARVNAISGAHKAMPQVLKALGAQLNVYLVGGAGTGKTTIAKQAAEGLGVPFYFCGAVFQKYELLGFIDAMGAYQSTTFRQAFENGGVFLFDEIDASDAAAIVAFNAAIANGICSFPDKIINRHPDFYCVAAANTSGHGATRQYIGRNPLDAASLDRFVIFNIELDPAIENGAALSAFTSLGGTNTALLEAALDYVQLARKTAEKLRLACVISPRASIDAAKLLAVGFDFDAAINAALFNKLDDTSARQIKGSMNNV